MKIQESAENYLETIFIIKTEKDNVRSIDVVNELGFSKASVSVAMKNLREDGYITVSEHGYINLTEKGLEIASSMYERHTLISNWLIQLGVPKEIALEDACRMEHVISSETFLALKKHVFHQE